MFLPLVLLATVLLKVDAQSLPLFINAGGSSETTDTSGNLWLPDSRFISSGRVHINGNKVISGTNDDFIYQAERFFLRTATYSLPIPAGKSKVTVVLHFAEIYFTKANQRLFGIKVQGEELATKFDIVQAAGGTNVAYTITRTVEVDCGRAPCTIEVDLVKGKQNPKINGIVLLPDTTSNTAEPTSEPTQGPTTLPTTKPTRVPTAAPTATPSRAPTTSPTTTPTRAPTTAPTAIPTRAPTTAVPSTAARTVSPSASMTSSTISSTYPSSLPSFWPSVMPTLISSAEPTAAPSESPSSSPTSMPSSEPTYIPPPPNDDCDGAEPLVLGESVTNSTSTARSQIDVSAWCGTLASAPGVWYKVVGNGEIVTASTCGFANYDTQLSVYRGQCRALQCVAGNDDGGCGMKSSVEWRAASEVAYYILVHGYGGATGDFRLDTSFTKTPVASPTSSPTRAPTETPTTSPTATPTRRVTARPTKTPTNTPTRTPTMAPTREPTAKPVATVAPTANPTPTPTPTPSPTDAPLAFPMSGITALKLVHAPTDTELLNLVNGMVIDLKELRVSAEFNVKAVNVGDSVKSVTFLETGKNEGAEPFAFCGDNGGDYFVCPSLGLGMNSVTVIPYSGGGQSGTKLPEVHVNFEVIDSRLNNPPPPPPPPSGSAGKWVEIDANANIEARHENCFVMVGRKAYLVGGRGFKRMDIYNPVTRTWSEGPEPPIQMHHMQCVAAQNKLWVVAAWTKWYPTEENAEHVYVYDPASGKWSTKKAMPAERRRGGAGVVVSKDESKIYVSHGNSGGHETEDNFATSLGYLDEYDIATDSWTALSSNAPNPRDHTGAALIDGRICVAGGRNGGELNWPEVAPTDCYDLATGQWSVEAPIPQVRAGSSYGTTCDGHLMVAGGEGAGKAWDQVDVFDGSEWRTVAKLVKGRHGTGLATDCVCNQIHIASGALAQGGGPESQSVETFFPSGDVDATCLQ